MALTLKTSLLALIPLIHALPKAGSTPESAQGNLVILDTGVGHRSTPVPQWRTQLRQLSIKGTNATTLQQFGPEWSTSFMPEPIGAYQLARSSTVDKVFLVTGQGILTTRSDGSNPTTILNSTSLRSITVSDERKKIFFGTNFDGFIRSADFDGSNVQVVRNVSQGIDWAISKSATMSNSYADGILIDDDGGWMYWSSSRGESGGSIRRAPLNTSWGGGSAADETEAKGEEVLVDGINMPGQLRILDGMLYWVEKGRWSNSPTSIKRLKLPRSSSSSSATTTMSPKPLPTETLVSSDQSSIFVEKDWTGSDTVLSIRSFAFDDKGEKIWFVCESSGRTMFGKLVQTRIDGKGGLKVLNEDTKDVGVPVGIEYVK